MIGSRYDLVGKVFFFSHTIVASRVVNVVAFTFGFVHVTAKVDATRTAKVAKNNVRDILID